jgi:hypothetical protein
MLAMFLPPSSPLASKEARTVPSPTLLPSEIFYTYLFTPSENYRLPSILDATNTPTLICMVATLYSQIANLQALTLKMYQSTLLHTAEKTHALGPIHHTKRRSLEKI